MNLSFIFIEECRYNSELIFDIFVLPRFLHWADSNLRISSVVILEDEYGIHVCGKQCAIAFVREGAAGVALLDVNYEALKKVKWKLSRCCLG